jgi:hypothetical protein
VDQRSGDAGPDQHGATSTSLQRTGSSSVRTGNDTRNRDG